MFTDKYINIFYSKKHFLIILHKDLQLAALNPKRIFRLLFINVIPLFYLYLSRSFYHYSSIMKKILFFILLFQAITGFARNGFTIRGTVEGHPSGEIYILSDLTRDTLASAPIFKGKFLLKGTSPAPQAAMLRIKGVVNGPVLFLENTAYSARLKVVPAYAPDPSGNFVKVEELENELHATITGGKDQKTADAFWEMLSVTAGEYEKLSRQYTEAEHRGDEQGLDRLETRAEALQQTTLEAAATLIAKNNDSYVSAYIIREYISDLCEDKPEELKKLYALLGEEASRSAYAPKPVGTGKMLQKDDILPNFSLAAPDGTEIALADIRGKIKILEFWSKSCSPCLQEIPKLSALYEKYKPLGLEIVAISLDKDKQTTEKLKQKYKLSWIQAGNYKPTDTDVKQLYGIYTLPYKIILTEDNRIIDKGHLSLRVVQKLLDSALTEKATTNTPK